MQVLERALRKERVPTNYKTMEKFIHEEVGGDQRTKKKLLPGIREFTEKLLQDSESRAIGRMMTSADDL